MIPHLDRSDRGFAVGLIVATDVVMVASLFAEGRNASGLEGLMILALGMGLAVLAAWSFVLSFFLWRWKRWARVAAVLTYGPMAIGGIVAAVDVLRRIRSDTVPFGAPRIHLVAPAVIAVLAGGVVTLVARREAA